MFVSASLYEGFGLPALEALAIGTPVLVTNKGSFPEIVGNKGWIVEPEAEALAEALLRVLGNQTPKISLYRSQKGIKLFLVAECSAVFRHLFLIGLDQSCCYGECCMSIRKFPAVVESDQIGTNVTIGEFVVIRAGVTLGNDVVIHPHVVIEFGVVIEDGGQIFPGAYIGKEPKGAGALARPLQFERRVVIGAIFRQSIRHVVIYYDVMIGERSLIGDGASIREQCRIGSRTVIGRHVPGRLTTMSRLATAPK